MADLFVYKNRSVRVMKLTQFGRIMMKKGPEDLQDEYDRDLMIKFHQALLTQSNLKVFTLWHLISLI